MPSNEEWRAMLGREELTDADISEFIKDLRNFLGQYLDDFFRDEFAPDEV